MDCKKHYDEIYHAGPEPWCPYCEIDRLRATIEAKDAEVDHWRVKAECYGRIVHGCTPALESAGYHVDKSGKGGAISAIKDAVERMAATIEAKDAEIAEAKKDTARLDWLQERMFLVENIRLDRIAGGSLLTEQCSRPGRNVEFNGSTLRAAIDDAREK